MKRTTLILTFLLATLLCFGQKEHLKPARDFKQYEGVLKKYYDNVFPLLHKGLSKKPYARYTCMPSFSREYAFSVEEIKGKYYIKSNTLSTNYWYAKIRMFVKVKKSKAEINNDLYLKVGELFELLAEQTKEPDEEIYGLDGVTYYFATTDKNGKVKIGETWSPDENSLLDRLVDICSTLYLIGNKKDITQTDILQKIDKLINELKQ